LGYSLKDVLGCIARLAHSKYIVFVWAYSNVLSNLTNVVIARENQFEEGNKE
jgi:hypothetical protein